MLAAISSIIIKYFWKVINMEIRELGQNKDLSLMNLKKCLVEIREDCEEGGKINLKLL